MDQIAVMAVPLLSSDGVLITVQSIVPLITDFTDAESSLIINMDPHYPIYLIDEQTNVTYNYSLPFSTIDFSGIFCL